MIGRRIFFSALMAPSAPSKAPLFWTAGSPLKEAGLKLDVTMWVPRFTQSVTVVKLILILNEVGIFSLSSYIDPVCDMLSPQFDHCFNLYMTQGV